MKRVLYGFMAICAILVIVSCGGSKGSKEYTDVEKMLMANDWKFQAQSFLDDLSDNLEETADLTANLKLDGDVGKIVNFFVETLIFLGEDDKRTGFNVFKRVIGEGWL
ncbi:MAG: hypothetical protein GX879_00500, partial [Bacteroidales bacterium]|nr:hypothetical protein [Bacteroidales bacterium]